MTRDLPPTFSKELRLEYYHYNILAGFPNSKNVLATLTKHSKCCHSNTAIGHAPTMSYLQPVYNYYYPLHPTLPITLTFIYTHYHLHTIITYLLTDLVSQLDSQLSAETKVYQDTLTNRAKIWQSISVSLNQASVYIKLMVAKQNLQPKWLLAISTGGKN